MHVGLIEDNPEILDLYEVSLHLKGHTFDSFMTGEEFCQRCLTDETEPSVLPYQALLVDLGLPGGVSGREVIERITQKATDDVLPCIIVISGADESALFRLHQAFPQILILRKSVSMSQVIHYLENRSKPSSEPQNVKARS